MFLTWTSQNQKGKLNVYLHFFFTKSRISLLLMQSVFKVALSFSSHLIINREEKHTI